KNILFIKNEVIIPINIKKEDKVKNNFCFTKLFPLPKKILIVIIRKKDKYRIISTSNPFKFTY
ncbi:hypothetical protein C5S22_14880, partial [Clostridium perfringens]